MKTNGRFIVIKRTGEKPGDTSHLVFVEWRDGVPVFAPDANLAMMFEYPDMAHYIRGKLEDEQKGRLSQDWEVWDMDQVSAENINARNMLDAILKGTEGGN